MDREYNLRDTRGYNSISYGAYVSTQKKIQIRIIGCRDDGEHEYITLNFAESSSKMKMYESSLLTLMEPMKLYISVDTDKVMNFQMTTDTISTRKGKAIVAYTIAVWEDDKSVNGTDIVFNLTAWKKEVK